MTEFTDTHSHLYVEEFDADRDEAVRRAITSGVTRLILPNIDLNSIDAMRRLAARYPDNMRMAMGLHPSEVTANWAKDLQVIENEIIEHPGEYLAIGEVGVDLYWSQEFINEQRFALERQLAMAQQHSLPVIIHCRNGLNEILNIIKDFPDVRTVFHCFCGNEAEVDAIRCISDVYFGIGGVVTFKNSNLRNVLQHIGLNRILLETDAPYLAPVPCRGKRNESSFLPYTASVIASTLNVSVGEVAAVTAENSRQLFGF